MSDITEEPGMEEIILRIQSLIPVVFQVSSLVFIHKENPIHKNITFEI